ncbi:unnamed protein product [Brachionus calyciflorus]|uniref:Uncharacterized protein n=1 Tax=Brachionus calyciflorus TaxID=104777 RepID=A0A813RDH0_9BILA|nr:unnamed protein product [Brachionus calyciflorus]
MSKIKETRLFLLLIILAIFLIYKNFTFQSRQKIIKGLKYLQYECLFDEDCGGWGDRLKGVLSAYAFAKILNRKFVIKMIKDCDLNNFFEPNDIDWDYRKIPKNLSSIELKYGSNIDYMNSIKTNYNVFQTDKPLIRFKASLMLMNVIPEIPIFRNKTKLLGQTDESKIHMAYFLNDWYEQMFKLKKEFRPKYKSFLKRLKPNKHTKMICAQIRLGDTGQYAYRDKDLQKDFWKFINKTFLIDKDPKINYTLFITSDHEKVKKEAREIFSDIEVVFNENSSLHIELLSKENKCKQVEDILFDFHLMQNCDIGVVSHSGYGILGLWNRPDPFKDLYVYTKRDQNDMRNDYWMRKNMTFLKFSKAEDIYFT